MLLSYSTTIFPKFLLILVWIHFQYYFFYLSIIICHFNNYEFFFPLDFFFVVCFMQVNSALHYPFGYPIKSVSMCFILENSL